MTEQMPADPRGFEEWCQRREILMVVVGGSDTHGVFKGKRIPVEDFVHLIEHGVAFSDVFFVLTHAEDLVEPEGGADYQRYFPRKEQGFPDIFLRPDLSTARVMSWHPHTAAVLGDYVLPGGEDVPIAPRGVLRRVVERAREMGYEAKIGLEFEFFLFRGDLRAIEDSGYRLDPLSTRPYTYSVYRASLDEEILRSIRDPMAQAGVWIEAFNPETGPGQFELNIRYADAMRAADDGFVYKNGVKELAGQRGLLASFMAKPSSEWAGSSCHLHQSLWRGDENAFHDEGGANGLSDVARRFAAGQLATMREFAAFFCPTVNSYRRLVPYSWAATTSSWGWDNRSTGLRAIGEIPSGKRLEHRLGGADVNPYIAIAAALAGGLYGLADEIDPPDPFQGDAYADDAPTFEKLPGTLEEAVAALEESKVAREWLGEDFVEYYLAMKRTELDLSRLHVTDWEVRRYIELA